MKASEVQMCTRHMFTALRNALCAAKEGDDSIGQSELQVAIVFAREIGIRKSLLQPYAEHVKILQKAKVCSLNSKESKNLNTKT